MGFILQTTYIICPKTTQREVFQINFHEGFMTGYYPAGHSMWPDENERGAIYREPEGRFLKDPVNFHVKPILRRCWEDFCCKVRKALEDRYGSFQNMCARYHVLTTLAAAETLKKLRWGEDDVV
ncbi:hypothetical protein FOZ63_026060 [Perkinsus olseni]|uniref:Uncharacterized protein n=1 Tax=Perkinsus olseni TaxID=32597 RepID=A0A7J6SQZ9_PEROL|nr:hypothetical protein FOZ63_026060 [Perkinsus olseni]KAF4741984.1 hypothetical protein FOZ62_013789 [Perkinsus olseni]